MKKVLSFLMSVNLVGSSSIMAVSCKNYAREENRANLNAIYPSDRDWNILNVNSDDLETVKNAVIESLKKYKKVEVKETEDIIFENYVPPSSIDRGSIIVTAVPSSKVVTGSSIICFVIFKKDLKTLKDKYPIISPEANTEASAFMLIKKIIKQELDKEVNVKRTDAKVVSFNPATKESNGSIKVVAYDDSYLVEGEITFATKYAGSTNS
ncbi:hypothetical protein SHELI_v1c10480 [Spiroplasma helicoides]|uniref:Spiralin n=1 Tax=Spiroplasma helicoides TaxID=216938 RepID=A0A1B3SM36_9MOLU|nr:hypothetical protein [Spiroplasma helicoides]AOG60995.1 hypothetical protein SHELI_v1c10480 [Spiroplasma helicoides]